MPRRPSPTLEGFRAGFRLPSLTLAEITWRWTVGAVAWALLFFSVVEYLDILPVSKADAILLWTRHPLLVARAIAHILHGSLSRAVLVALLGVLALSVIWIIVGAIGRLATVRALLDHFRADFFRNVSAEKGEASETGGLRSLIGLNFLRAALVLAATLAFVGALILVSLVSSDASPQPGLAFLLFVLLAGLICVVWPALNWLLSIACIFAVRDGEDTLGALFDAVDFLRERSGPIFAVSTWTGLVHLAVLVGASVMASLTLAFLQVAPTRLVIAGIILVTLIYAALVDWLYIVRLAGYVCIAEMPDAPSESTPLSAAPRAGEGFAAMPRAPSGIDRDEPILSDVPGLIVET